MTEPEAHLKTTEANYTTIEIKPGFQLKRDILPLLSAAFGLSLAETEEILLTKRDSLQSYEGVFSPGRFRLTNDSKLPDFLDEMEVRLTERLKGLEKPEEAMILASIVEAEALSGSHYKEIADVFLNRLAGSHELQSCVTVEYAIGLQRLVLYVEDTKTRSPYNTYLSKGLPPGPIAVFSDEALKAVVSPVQYPELYYFYYDYLKNEPVFFKDYESFQQESSKAAGELKASGKDLRSPINKQRIFSTKRP